MLQNCNYNFIDDNGVEHSFSNEWELDSYLYNHRRSFLSKDSKSSILFSAENKADATNSKIEELKRKTESLRVEIKPANTSEESEESEAIYAIPGSIGVSTFIKTGTATSDFVIDDLFVRWGISDIITKRAFEKDFGKIRITGDLLHSILDYLNNHRDASIEDVKRDIISKDTNNLIDPVAIESVISTIADILSKLHSKFKYVHTEIPVISDKFDSTLAIAGKTSVNGRLDIVCIDDNGAVHIFDLKTSPKDVGSWGITSNEEIGMNEYSSAKKREITRQLVAYEQILTQNGFNVASLNILPLRCDFEYEGETNITRGDEVVTKPVGIKQLKGVYLQDTVSNFNGSEVRTARNDFGKYLSNPNNAVLDIYKDVVIPKTKKLFKEYERQEKVSKTVDSIFNNRKRVVRVTDKPGYKFYFYNEFEAKDDRVIYCKDEQECKEQIAKYLKQLEKSTGETNTTIANNIANVLSGSIEIGSFLDSTPFSKRMKEQYTKIFSPYLQYGDISWQLVDNEALIRFGIFMFRSSTGMIDVVQLSDQPLRDLVDLKYGKSILGSYMRDYDENIHHDKLVDSTYGNIELLSTLLLLNSNKNLITGCQIRSMIVHNPNAGIATELPTSILLHNFKRVCDYANLYDKEFPKIKVEISSDDFISLFDYTVDQLSGKKIGTLYISKYKGDVNDKMEAIKWVKSTMDVIREYSSTVRNSIVSGKWDLNHEESASFILLSRTLLFLTGNELSVENDAPSYAKFSGGVSVGINLTTPQFAPSQAMRSLGIVVQRTHTKINSQLSKLINKELGKHLDALYKAKGHHDFRAFKNMFVTEGGKITPEFTVKSYSDPTLSTEERNFLKKYFEILDSFRYASEIEMEDALADGSYYQVPLMKAEFLEQAISGDVKSAVKHKFNDQLEELNLFKEQKGTRDAAKEDYLPYNPFDISVDTRTTLLRENGASAFETNLEKVIIAYAKAKLRENEYKRIMPEVLGLKTMLAYHHQMYGQKIDIAMEAFDKYVTLILFDSPVMDESLQGAYRVLNVIKGIASTTTLGLNYRSGMREILQGMWTHISRTMVEMYGKDQFNLKDIARAWTIVFKMGLKNPNFITMFEQLNADYQMTNAGISEIETLISRSKAGLLNFSSDDLYIFNKIPDYFHRMGILIAKMLHDGSWDAHSMKDGVMVYDFNKDKRFNLLNRPGVNKSSKEYKDQLATYIVMRDQFISEGYQIAEVDLTKPLQELPRAYTLQESGSIKLFADLCFGHYDKETQMLLKHTFLGAFIMHFKTFYSAKLEQWILEPNSYKGMGQYKEVFDAEGVRYMKKFITSENGEVTTEIVKESELQEGDYAIPMKDWEGKYMEGIAYTVVDLTKSLVKRDFDEFAHQMKNPTKKGNFILFLRDMLWANIAMWIIAALFLNKDDMDYNLLEYSMLSAWHQSYSDGPITNLLAAQIGDLNPPMYRTIKKYWNNTVDLVSGKKNAWEWAYSTFGALRDVGATINNIV